MIGRLGDRQVKVIGSRTMPGLRSLVSHANAGSDLELSFPWKVEENSDHFNFFSRQIPFLLFHSGLHDDYHRPTDDVEHLDVDGIQAITKLIFKSALLLANENTLGSFRPGSRFESNRDEKNFEKALPPVPPRLGISWRVDQEQGGLVVQSVRYGSAANEAGLAPGDRLVELNDRPLLSSSTLQQAAVRSNELQLSIVPAGETEPTEVAVALPGEPSRIGVSWRYSAVTPQMVAVVRVVPHSRAHVAGIRVGDRIYQVNGTGVESSEQFQELVVTAELPATFLIERSGRLQELVLPGE